MAAYRRVYDSVLPASGRLVANCYTPPTLFNATRLDYVPFRFPHLLLFRYSGFPRDHDPCDDEADSSPHRHAGAVAAVVGCSRASSNYVTTHRSERTCNDAVAPPPTERRQNALTTTHPPEHCGRTTAVLAPDVHLSGINPAVGGPDDG